ncbi:MAG: lysine--tRNA ligase [Anaerolineales bacterium]|nr:lysine--tRNA ligase [Anaerolineales bacterium]
MTFNKLEQIRLEKLERLQAQGVEPYPHQSHRTHTSREAIAAFEKTEPAEGTAPVQGATPVRVTLAGRIRSLRPMGKIAFAHIEDGTGRIQLFFRTNDVGDEALKMLVNDFDLGDFIEAEGEMMRSKTGEITLRVSTFRLLAKSITPLPAAKDEVVDGEVIRHAGLTDPETRYRQRYADLAVNAEVRQIFQTRAAIFRAMREFMDAHGFLEVETPILQPIYGGAAARPFTTHHNQLKQDLYLRISFELYLKRLLVGGLERVYEIGRDFRNEGVDRTHNPEFTMMEFYWAYADYQMVMDFTERMVRHIVERVTGGTTITYQGREIDFGQTWARMDLREAVIELSGINVDDFPDADSLRAEMRRRKIEANPTAPRGKLIENLVGEFVEPTLIQPTFLYDYPRDVSPLAKSKPGDPSTVERFEGYVAGFEICNAFTELNDPLDQQARFEEMGRAYAKDDDDRHPLDEDYLQAMRYGMPPNGGFGMGVDRLVMLLTDQANIREVLLFPHLRKTE